MRTDIRVGFRDAAGAVSTCDLSAADPALLVASIPWRVFRWSRGQAHYSGWYWCTTTGGHVVYESRLELARLILADFDPHVAAIAAQPFLLAAPDGGRTRRHVPDFLLVDRDGLVTVVNVKPSSKLGEPKVAAALDWAGKVFADRGWRHEVWSGTDPVRLANVQFLAGYRHTERVDADAVAALAQLLRAPAAIGEVEAYLAGPYSAAVCRPALLHLLWRGVLRADLDEPLSAATLVECAA